MFPLRARLSLCARSPRFLRASTTLVGVEPVRGLPRGGRPSAAAASPAAGAPSPPTAQCGPVPGPDDVEETVPMVDPASGEWGGPTKGGSLPEPTRFGDWERKGRCSDF